MSRMMMPALGILFFYIGVLCANAKRNWFIGIRTPWTLSSDVVWRKTHKLGSVFFKIAGVIAIFGFFFDEYAVWLVLIPLLASTLCLVIYSYVEYQKLK